MDAHHQMSPRKCQLVRAFPVCAIAEIYRPIVASSPISFETESPDELEIGRRIERTLPAFPWLVCESQGSRLLVAPTAALTARARRTSGLWTRPSTCIQGFGVAESAKVCTFRYSGFLPLKAISMRSPASPCQIPAASGFTSQLDSNTLAWIAP